MYDYEIQRATRAQLDAKMASLGPYPLAGGCGSAKADLAIRIAKELRSRNVREGKIPPSEDRPRLRMMLRQDR